MLDETQRQNALVELWESELLPVLLVGFEAAVQKALNLPEFSITAPPAAVTAAALPCADKALDRGARDRLRSEIDAQFNAKFAILEKDTGVGVWTGPGAEVNNVLTQVVRDALNANMDAAGIQHSAELLDARVQYASKLQEAEAQNLASRAAGDWKAGDSGVWDPQGKVETRTGRVGTVPAGFRLADNQDIAPGYARIIRSAGQEPEIIKLGPDSVLGVNKVYQRAEYVPVDNQSLVPADKVRVTRILKSERVSRGGKFVSTGRLIPDSERPVLVVPNSIYEASQKGTEFTLASDQTLGFDGKARYVRAAAKRRGTWVRTPSYRQVIDRIPVMSSDGKQKNINGIPQFRTVVTRVADNTVPTALELVPDTGNKFVRQGDVLVPRPVQKINPLWFKDQTANSLWTDEVGRPLASPVAVSRAGRIPRSVAPQKTWVTNSTVTQKELDGIINGAKATLKKATTETINLINLYVTRDCLPVEDAVRQALNPARMKQIMDLPLHQAANEATSLLADKLAAETPAGLPTLKLWIDRHDALVRPTHRHVTPVPAGKDFHVGGWPARHPHDFLLPVSQRINCRCVLGIQPGFNADPIASDLGVQARVYKSSEFPDLQDSLRTVAAANRIDLTVYTQNFQQGGLNRFRVVRVIPSEGSGLVRRKNLTKLTTETVTGADYHTPAGLTSWLKLEAGSRWKTEQGIA